MNLEKKYVAMHKSTSEMALITPCFVLEPPDRTTEFGCDRINKGDTKPYYRYSGSLLEDKSGNVFYVAHGILRHFEVLGEF